MKQKSAQSKRRHTWYALPLTRSCVWQRRLHCGLFVSPPQTETWTHEVCLSAMSGLFSAHCGVTLVSLPLLTQRGHESSHSCLCWPTLLWRQSLLSLADVPCRRQCHSTHQTFWHEQGLLLCCRLSRETPHRCHCARPSAPHGLAWRLDAVLSKTANCDRARRNATLRAMSKSR